MAKSKPAPKVKPRAAVDLLREAEAEIEQSRGLCAVGQPTLAADLARVAARKISLALDAGATSGQVADALEGAERALARARGMLGREVAP